MVWGLDTWKRREEKIDDVFEICCEYRALKARL
jgi:hypothetical protein